MPAVCGLLAGALLLVAGCNQLTGVNDLKVADCGPDAGADAGACQTEQESLRQRDSGVRDPELGDVGPRDLGAGGAANIGGSLGAGGSPSLPREMAEGGCEPGSVVQCLGEGSCAGTQICLDDGRSFSGCQCGPSAVVSAGSVGAACADDGDCAAGLGCTSAQSSSGPFSGGGPQGGFCSRPCAGDDDCVASDPNALCIRHSGGPAFCFPECSRQVPSFPAQCNGRSELTCLPIANSTRGYCAPACQTDSDCAPRSCDLGTGLCSDSVNDGEPIGGACSSDGDCAAGMCVSLPGQPPACTGLCTLGSIAGCGFGEDDSPRLAACTSNLAGEVGLEVGAGAGLCQQLCDVDEDCAQADGGWGCSPWPDLDSPDLVDNEERLGSIGFCEPQGPGGSCNDSCLFANNGSCEDDGSFLALCDPGTDCSDCGPG